MFTNESEASAESETYDSASVVPNHTRLELSSDSDSAYDSASVASVASVNQPLRFARARAHVRALMTQKSCAVGMRNAILRNYLKLPTKKTRTATAAARSLNKTINEQNNSCARALQIFVHLLAVLSKTTK